MAIHLLKKKLSPNVRDNTVDRKRISLPTESPEEMTYRILTFLENDPQDDKVPYFNSEEELYFSTLTKLRKDKHITGKLVDARGSTSYNKSSILLDRITSAGKEYLAQLRRKYQKNEI